MCKLASLYIYLKAKKASVHLSVMPITCLGLPILTHQLSNNKSSVYSKLDNTG